MKGFIICFLLCISVTAWTQESEVDAERLLQQVLTEELGTRFSSNNSVVLLYTGQNKFDAMFNAIRQARHYVHLEYFNFRNDSIGLALFDLLGQKAAEGVEVRAMFDSFGNSSNDSPLQNRHLEAIRETGVQVEEFDPIKFPWINHAYHRDHRKIVVIDGAVAYTGGMNVADYYIHGRPEYGEWRDMHMELTGDVVAEYERLFARMWWEQTGEILLPQPSTLNSQLSTLNSQLSTSNSQLSTLNPQLSTFNSQPSTSNSQLSTSNPQLSTFNSQLSTSFTLLPDTTSTAGHKTIGVVERGPGLHSKDMRKAYVAAIDAAQHHIQIVNPYPTNVKSVRRALRRALKRGVRMEIMVSAKSDVPITPDVVALEMKKLAKRGAEVYYNQTGFHHSKVMMVDGRYCTVGSTNLDARSFCFDYEVNSFIFDAATTRQLQHIFEQDKRNCTTFTVDDYRRTQNFGHRLTGHFFSLFRGFF